MTNLLPATLVEAEAIAAVSQWVEVIQAKMTAEASREWLGSTLRDFLRRGLIETLKVIEAADAGDEIADAALRRVCAEMLDRGEMLPAALRTYCEKALLRGPINTRTAGRNMWFDNWRRDIGIAVLVYLTKERFGLRPTRNRTSKRKPSACSVVSAALGQVRINTAEKRVENIWAGLAGQVTTFVISQKMSPSIPQN
jgi:hypothetical protein